MALSGAVPDGSLVFLCHDHGMVKLVTGSRVTHSAMVFNHGGVPWVYDAWRPKVRRMPLPEYEKFVAKEGEEMWLLRPRRNYSSVEVARMLEYAKSQLGRSYGVKAYVAGKPTRPIHCSWYTTETLARSGRYVSDKPWSVSPIDLLESVLSVHFAPEKVNLGESHATQTIPR